MEETNNLQEKKSQSSKMIILGIIAFLVLGAILLIKPQSNSEENGKVGEIEPININLQETGGDVVDNIEVTELEVEDLIIGEGEEATAGAKLTVNYKGTLTDGTEFDSSYDSGTPFNFILGAGEVISGWDQGLVGMRVGGKRKLTIPSDMAYGASGAGGVIPPNATLIFEVELINVE